MTENVIKCWICLEEELELKNDSYSDSNNLVKICNCRNDIAYCHYDCIQKWIFKSHITKCQFCNSYYKLDDNFILSFFKKKIILILKNYNNIYNIVNEFIDNFNINYENNIEILDFLYY